MSDGDPVIEQAAAVHSLALPTVHKELVHSSVHDALDEGISELICQYAGVSGQSATMHNLYLAPNAAITDEGRLTGYVATINGSAPADPVVTATTGAGTTWLRVNGAEDAQRLAAVFRPSGAHKNMRVSVVSGDEYPSTVQYIVAEGNDHEAATALASEVEHTRATLDDVVEGRLAADYVQVIQRSKDARMRAIQEFMSAHGLESTGAQEGDHVSDYLVKVRALSKQAVSARIAGSNVYAAYSGVADPSESTLGVMVYRGPIAGYSLIKEREHSVGGKAANSWVNASSVRPFSMFPVDTGRFTKGSSRAADRNRETNDRVRAAHAERVKWAGKVSSYNPRALEVFHAPDDLHLIGAHKKLGVVPGGSITQQHLNTLVCEVPGLVTSDLPLERLVDVAERSTERSLPVKTGSFLRMLAQWDDAPAQRLSKLFETQEGDQVDVDTDVLKAMHKASMTRRYE